MRRDSSFCAKSVRYNIFTNGAPYSPLFTTLTASHCCAPQLPPISGQANQSAVRLAPEASHTVPYG